MIEVDRYVDSPNTVLLLAGNKADLDDRRIVGRVDAKVM